jgi:ribonuclease D
MTVNLIESPAAFADLMVQLQGAGRVAVDTEAASFHRYHDRIYLVQVSSADVHAVIDPLLIGDPAQLGALLRDPQIEIIFHDADYDLRLLQRQWGFTATRLFDTRIAAQLLGEPGVGLAALLELYFQVRPDKRFQRADWSARPLTDPMLDYAAGDTAHLIQLRDILYEKLKTSGRLAWAEEEFLRLENARWDWTPNDPVTNFIHLKGARALDRRGLALLRELYVWRETLASQLDRASFRVMGNEVLLQLAAHPVATFQELEQVRGIGRDILHRQGDELLAAMARGLAVPEDALPRFERGPRRVVDPTFESRVEALKQQRNKAAERYGLQPGVICPNGTLEAIARLQPESVDAMAAIPEMRAWQRREFGAELLEAMQAPPPLPSATPPSVAAAVSETPSDD